MGSISDKLAYLEETKDAIKDSIISNGVDVSTGDSFRSYADKIEEMKNVNMLLPLPYENKNIYGRTVKCCPYIKIYASDRNSYTVEQWGELVHSNPNLKDTLEPIGIEFSAGGEHFVIFFYVERIPDHITLPGTNKTGTVVGVVNSNTRLNSISWNRLNLTPVGDQYFGMRICLYNYFFIQDSNIATNVPWRWTANPDGTTASVVKDKNDFILTTQNAPFTWKITAFCAYRNVLTRSERDIQMLDAYYAQNEWLRHRASIIAKDGSGNDVTTGLADGTYADRVDIVTENGEMYFKIIVDENDSTEDIMTSNLAKYNIHQFCCTTSASNYNSITGPSASIINQIYNDQKANGVNMNSGLDPNDTLRILTPGSKGAEAYVFQGKWRIITPILTQYSADYTLDRNMADSPMIYYWKNVLVPKFRDEYGIEGIQLVNERWALIYSINRNVILASIRDFLHSTQGGSYSWETVPALFTDYASLVRTGVINGIIGGLMSGNPYSAWLGDYSRRIPYVGLNLDVITPPVITFNENTKYVTITAESGYDIWYTISGNEYPPIDLSNYNIYQRNTNAKKYSAPFTPSSSYAHFTVSAVAVRKNAMEKQSIVTCEYFEIPAPDPPIIYEGSIFSGQQRTYWMRTTDTSCDIYYTWTNDAVGRNPDLNNLTTSISEVYNGKTKKFNKSNLNVSEIQTRFGYNTIKAIAVKNGVSSSVTTFTIEIIESAGDDWGD